MLKIVNKKEEKMVEFGTLGVGDIFLDGTQPHIVLPESYEIHNILLKVGQVLDSADVHHWKYNAMSLDTKTLTYLSPDEQVVVPDGATLILE